MRKMFLKKWWAVLISLPCVAGGIALACAGGDLDEYGTSNFTPEPFVDSSYRPFFYSWYYYYGIGHDEAHNVRFNQSNINEWSSYLENKVPSSELEFLLLNSSAGIADSAAAYAGGSLKTLHPELKSLNIVSTRNSKVTDFLQYLALAKKCEEFAVNEIAYWEEAPKKKPIANADKFHRGLQERFTKTKDVFLKQRYLFQLVRSYFFNGPPQQAIDVFESNKNAFPKNTMYYRTLSYAAGAYYKQKNYSKANYYYSRVYDEYNELKTVAHYSFHPQEEGDWKNTLALCQNKNEQATLWQMLGVFYQDEKRAISEIYQLDPKNEKLDLLLTRAVNKEEQKFIEWRERIAATKPKLVSELINAELIALVSRIAGSANTGKPYLWHIASGYLYMLNGDFSKAQANYVQAEKSLPSQQLPRFQLKMFKLMNKIASANRIDANLENEILKDVEWLAGLSSNNEGLRYYEALEWMRHTMAFKYKKQKELVKAECFRSYPEFYANNANVEAMKAFIDKPNKSAYEKVCVGLYDKSKNDLLEFQAMRLAYEDKLTEAIALMEMSGENRNKGLLGNPFNGRIQDCHDCDHAAAQKIKYNKLSVLQKMKEMQDKVVAGDDVYNNALLLANAHYNLTHYGNGRYFYESKVMGEAHYSPFDIDSVFMNTLLGMKQSVKYYNLALQSAKTDEQKAKCHFMLAKCERNQWYNEKLYLTGKEYETELPVDFVAWNGFKALKQYPITQYYKDVIKECGYFRTYVNK
ncbi:MAG: hypothetical protein WCF67_18550 [Chitinophagaceae bacterium]